MEVGKCPKCGSESLEYEELEEQDGMVYYPFTCECGATGKEWYILTYSETTFSG